MAETRAIDIAEGELRRLGERVTAPRRAVIAVLASTDDHLSAMEVAERAQALGSDLHLASVYRAVDTLTRLGLVVHTHLPGGSTTYHLETHASPPRHAHAQCSSCGAVVDVPEEWLIRCRPGSTTSWGSRSPPPTPRCSDSASAARALRQALGQPPTTRDMSTGSTLKECRCVRPAAGGRGRFPRRGRVHAGRRLRRSPAATGPDRGARPGRAPSEASPTCCSTWSPPPAVWPG